MWVTSWVAKSLLKTQGLWGISVCKFEATFAAYMQKVAEYRSEKLIKRQY